MRKFFISCIAVASMVLSACTTMKQNDANVAMAKYKVNFKLPPSQKWDLVSVEQDANGYAKSYRSDAAKGLAADQSFYINYGHGIKTPVLTSMHEVVGSLSSTGCKRTHSQILKLDKNILIFNASADQCMSGRSVWQVFKVFNMEDGQYSIVYSANPRVVAVNKREQMKTVVMNSKIARI